jgi:hypothetical protein
MVARSVARFAVVAAMSSGALTARADVPIDTAGRATLPETYGPHWVWVDDVSFFHLPDGLGHEPDVPSLATLDDTKVPSPR